MATVNHADLLVGDIHGPHQWEYADAAARTGAGGFAAGDVGKLARQLDTNTLWMLTDDSPATWQQVGGYVPGGTDVAVADGGTGASTASGARTNLGLVIATDVEAHNANLTTIAGLTATTDNFLVAVASAWASRTPAQAKTTLALNNVDNTSNATERAAAATLTNKTLTAPLQSSYEDFTEMAAPGTPAGGTVRVYAKADGLIYSKDDAGVETVVTGGGGGGSALTVEEVDGTPTDSAVTKIIFPNGTLGIVGHEATYTPSGAGGDVVGPASSVASEVALFDGTTGKLIKRATGTGIASLASGVLSASTAPTFADFTNANHDHGDADDGGTLDAAAIASGTIAQARLGSGSGGAGTKVLYDDQTYKTPAAGGDASTNTATSVDSEIALFSSTTGKILKRATTTGVLKAASGVIAAAVAGTDYAPAEIGYMPWALSYGMTVQSTAGASGSLAAVGGTALFPIQVDEPLVLESITVRSADTSLARSWEARLFREPAGGGSTLDAVTGTDCSESFTASAASNRTATISGSPVTLDPGLYWLAVRNTHATNTFGFGIVNASNTIGANTGQTKTLGSALTTTLDAVTSWSKVANLYMAKLNGRTFGQASIF